MNSYRFIVRVEYSGKEDSFQIDCEGDNFTDAVNRLANQFTKSANDYVFVDSYRGLHVYPNTSVETIEIVALTEVD